MHAVLRKQMQVTYILRSTEVNDPIPLLCGTAIYLGGGEAKLEPLLEHGSSCFQLSPLALELVNIAAAHRAAVDWWMSKEGAKIVNLHGLPPNASSNESTSTSIM